VAYALESATLPILAFVIQYAGLLAERWYFFAEATHPQNLYYQSVA
jgi:DMSO reductase anchor subunit